MEELQALEVRALYSRYETGLFGREWMTAEIMSGFVVDVGDLTRLVQAATGIRRIDDAEQYAQWLDRAWLDAEIATATLLLGGPGADRATLALGPSRAAALRSSAIESGFVAEVGRLESRGIAATI